MRSKKVITLVPGKVEVSIPSNIHQLRYLYFGEFSDPIDFFKNYIGKSAIKIDLHIISYKEFIGRSVVGFTQFSKDIRLKKNSIYFLKRVFFFKFGIALEKQSELEFKFFVTPHYFKYIKEKFGNIYPFGIHLFDLIHLEILKGGDFVFYGSSFFNTLRNEASLIIAPSGVGKTRSVLKLITQDGCKLLGEEVTYIDCTSKSPHVVCTPHTSTTNLEKHSGWIGFFNSLFSSQMKSLFHTYGSDFFAFGGELKRVYILENSFEEGITKINKEESFYKISLIQNLFTYFSNGILQASSYNQMCDILSIRKKEEETLRLILSSVRVYCIRARSSERFYSFIQQIEKNI
jgi:hypothetical protein